MSSYLAIATVTEALRQMAENSAKDAEFSGQSLAVVLRPPNNLTAGHPPDLPTTFAGVYPYHIMPNAQWRNASLPNRRSDGSLVQGVRSAYDIDFLVTCYGDDKQLEPQRMLGALLARLATEPVLTKAMIKSAFYCLSLIFEKPRLLNSKRHF